MAASNRDVEFAERLTKVESEQKNTNGLLASLVVSNQRIEDKLDRGSAEFRRQGDRLTVLETQNKGRSTAMHYFLTAGIAAISGLLGGGGLLWLLLKTMVQKATGAEGP